MKTLYSGFDTIILAVQGALAPASLEHLERSKLKAKEADAEYLTKLGKPARDVHVRSHGQQGGYAYVINTGSLGEHICFKNSLDRTKWNGLVKLRSVTLAVLGWRKAVEQAMKALSDIGFHVAEVSMNRVDYCIDILNAPLILDPKNFVAHARMTKTAYSERCTDVSRGDTCETVTIGKSPGLQVTIYDKRREVIAKKKPYWFEIWKIDPTDITLTVHRVEIRAGKNELKKYGLTTWDDFERIIGDIINAAIKRIRYIEAREDNSNISRQPLHPTWLHVKHHVEGDLLDHVSNTEPARVLHVLRKQKSQEYLSQIIGLMAGLAVCENIDLEHVGNHGTEHVLKAILDMGYAEKSPLRRAYVRARDRLVFIV